MHRELAKLILYRDMSGESILTKLGDVFRRFHAGTASKEELTTDIYIEMKRLLEVATQYGFNTNLWHNYLTFLLITDENPFSLTCEKTGANDGSVNFFAKSDFEVFRKLFHYDFFEIEQALDIHCFSAISDYTAIAKKERMYNKNVSEKVQVLSLQLAEVANADEMFEAITGFYKAYGVGMFGLNKAFRIGRSKDDELEFYPINNMDKVMLTDLIGYEIQKQKLIDNTEAFVEGRRANNVLLYGDSGTGKSTSIKAIVNQYYDKGLRMIEIYKHQFQDLSAVIAHVKNRNYRYIIYMDDLSFEEFEIEYKYLKAVIEGGVETKPDNVLIYATSNRRHLIKETWNDRDDMQRSNGLHHSDTMEEKLSLVNRFGVKIGFSKPGKKDFNEIVLGLTKRYPEITMSEEEILKEANKWEISHGGMSGRTAQQFADYLAGQRKDN
ncbi:MAG: ATP-binding protein [Lachnospiraceae bacterium]|nr:ATP-binding protein [Lachnospiraceae bacterium]